jgi:hypothetical protein
MRERERERAMAPRCPFCEAALKRPEAVDTGDADRIPGGTCECGALYLVDSTGKNVGTVMAQALVKAADMLGKKVSDLDPDGDYEDAVLSYDWRTHRSLGRVTGYMDGYGRLYLLRIRGKHPR